MAEASKEKPKPPLSIAKTFGCSAFSASFAEICTIPIDTAKVRLQLQGKEAVGAVTGLKYRGMFGTMATIAKEEGAASLWKGVVPGLHRQCLFGGLRIGLYEPVKNLYVGKDYVGDAPLYKKILAALTTGALAITVASPTDLVKVRLQSEGKLPPGVPRRYNGAMNAYATIIRQEGVSALWTGLGPNVARNAIVNAAELASYDQVKQTLLKIPGFSDNMFTHLLSGLGAGFFAVCIGSPVDVVKSRMMGNSSAYKGTIDCFIKTFKNDIILKSHRDTHCHFCFRSLPADCIPCDFCSIPLYCSEYCMEIAGKGFSRSKICSDSSFSSQTFDDYCNQIHTLTIKETDAHQMDQSEQVKEFFPEHKHECGGMSWPAVFPVEVSLAARVLMKSTKKMSPNSSLNHTDLMLPQLCQHYEKMKLADRLELHVFALVLVLCLHTSNQNIQLTGSMISIGIRAIAQVKTNAMAVVDITNMDGADNIAMSSSTLPKDSMCPIEQVQVAQAVYLTGSSFNHSCLPNVHASFSNRSLCVHAIKDVAAGSPLELCYGPQVGEFRLEARQRWLEERYMFLCTCKGCSELNFSDLTLSSFRCSNDLCDGVVINGDVRLERPSASNSVRYISDHSWKLAVPADFDTQEKLNQVAHLLMAEHSSSMGEFSSVHCLSCGLPCDIIGRQKLVSHSWECLKRAKTEVSLPSAVPNESSHNIAMQSLKSLRSALHKFHKDVAQAEDVVAEILCMMGQHELALHHLKESVKILEAIYHNTHIVVGNELVKLVSVALCISKSECTKYFERIDQIFSTHYGCNYAKQFPYLETISNLIQ